MGAAIRIATARKKATATPAKTATTARSATTTNRTATRTATPISPNYGGTSRSATPVSVPVTTASPTTTTAPTYGRGTSDARPSRGGTMPAPAAPATTKTNYLTGGVPGTGAQMLGGFLSALPGNVPKIIGNLITGLGLQAQQNYSDASATSSMNAATGVQLGARPGSNIEESIRYGGEAARSELGLGRNEGIVGRTIRDATRAGAALISGTGRAYDTAEEEITSAVPKYKASSNAYWKTAGQAYDKTAQEMMEATGQYAGDVTQQYQDRMARNMGYIDTLGQVQRDYVNQQYDKMNALTTQRLTDMGLGGTTVGASMLAGNERRRIQDMNMVEEQIMANKFNADVGLSGDVAGAVERMGGMTTDLANVIAQNRYGLATGQAGDVRGLADWQTGALSNLATQQAFAMPELQYGVSNSLIGQRLNLANQATNVLTSAQVVPPDFSPYYNASQQMGYSSVPAYSNNSLFGGYGGIGGAGIGFGTGMLIGGFTPVGGLAGGLIGGAVGGGTGLLMDQ